VAAQGQVAHEVENGAEPNNNAPFVPQAQAMDVDEADSEDADADEDEDEDNDEADDEDGSDSDDEEADEGEDEEEEGDEQFSFLEATAAAAAEASTKAADSAATVTGADAAAVAADAIAPPLALPNKPFKFHTERVEAQGSKDEDPEMGKLDLALEAVKEDILSTNKQITDERKWVIAVAKIIASYNDKMKRVEGHIVALRKEMKNLYRKKKQIENLKLQKALEAKLKEAKDELATLTNSLKHVQSKQGELNKSGRDLKETIAGIQAQLAKLRGQQMKKPKPAVLGKGKGKGKGGKGKGKNGKGKGKGKGKSKCKKGLKYSKKAKKCLPAKKKGQMFGR